MCDGAVCDEAKRTNEICPVEPDEADIVQVGPPGRVYARLQHDEVLALVVERKDGKFVVWWTDYVVNEHEEEFDDLAVAVARLAVIMRCAPNNWASMFGDDADEFATKAAEFLDASVIDVPQ